MSSNLPVIERAEPLHHPNTDQPSPGHLQKFSPSRTDLRHRFVLGVNVYAFVAVILLYIGPGLIGHQPWKQDETYIMEIVRNMLATDDFVVPRMAGETFMEKPPLFYWVAAALAKLFTPVLALHDGARLANGIFLLLTFAAVARCGRRWCDPQFGRTAVFMLLACLGLEAYAHLMLTDIALVAGIAIGIAGLPRWRTHPVASGLEIGTGIGLGFLAKGLLAPGVFALSALLLPLCFSNWRRPAYLRTSLVAMAAALPWLLIWPVALYLQSPTLFFDWFWLNNIGRFVGFSVPVLGAPHYDGFWFKHLWWIIFPAAPLAALSLWRERGSIRTNELVQATVVFSAVIAAVLIFSASARGGYALPLLLPLSLLGASSALTLEPRLERAWSIGGAILFSTVGTSIWLAWAYVMFSNDPLHFHWLYHQLPPHPERHVNIWLIGCALAATVGAAALMFWRAPRQMALQTWVVGITFCWLSLATLFMPWIDAVKSYRQVFESLYAATGTPVDCIASYGLRESERAMLRYYDGIVTERLEVQPHSACPLVLVERSGGRMTGCSGNQPWLEIWQGARPSDHEERFWLFKRPPGSSAICHD